MGNNEFCEAIIYFHNQNNQKEYISSFFVPLIIQNFENLKILFSVDLLVRKLAQYGIIIFLYLRSSQNLKNHYLYIVYMVYINGNINITLFDNILKNSFHFYYCSYLSFVKELLIGQRFFVDPLAIENKIVLLMRDFHLYVEVHLL